MQTWFTRARARRRAMAEARREAERLSALPAYLLRDMGLTLDGRDALARQLRSGRR